MTKFIKDWWQQLIGVPAALLLFIYAPGFIRWIDPTSATLDAGVLHVVNFAFVQLLIYNALAWVGIIVSFPAIANFFKFQFYQSFNTFNNLQKCVIGFSVLFAYLFALVLLSLAL